LTFIISYTLDIAEPTKCSWN